MLLSFLTKSKVTRYIFQAKHGRGKQAKSKLLKARKTSISPIFSGEVLVRPGGVPTYRFDRSEPSILNPNPCANVTTDEGCIILAAPSRLVAHDGLIQTKPLCRRLTFHGPIKRPKRDRCYLYFFNCFSTKKSLTKYWFLNKAPCWSNFLIFYDQRQNLCAFDLRWGPEMKFWNENQSDHTLPCILIHN